MVSTLFRDPQARSSALAALGTPQPRAFRSLNRVETLDSASNYYLEYSCNKCCNLIGHSEVSISHRDLQVFHRDLHVFHRDLQLSGWGQTSVSLQ